MASLVPLLTQGSFQNWLKGTLGVLIAKEGLTDFVRTEITQFQTDLLQFIWTSTGIPAGTKCNICTTANLQKGQPCPNGICDALMKALRKEHRFNNPSWKNTDARGWCTDAFELSKCFMPRDGYSATRTFEDTDLNGTLSVIINNKRFQRKFMASPPLAICKKAREIGRAIRHSPDLLMTDADLAQYLTDLIILLSDPKFFASDPIAQAAVNKLNQLQTNTLTIHANDITQIIHDNIGRSISRQHQAVLQDITSHLNDVKTASINAIDKIIKAKTLTALNEIQMKSKQMVLEMKVHMDQKQKEFDEHIDANKQVIDIHSDRKKQDIDKHMDANKKTIDTHADRKKQDIDKHMDANKKAIDTHADRKKQDIDKHMDANKKAIDTHADRKKQDIDKHIDANKKAIDTHADRKKQDFDKHIDANKETIDIHADRKKQDIDKHMDANKKAIDTHADRKKQDIDKHMDANKKAIDTHADRKKQDIDKHIDANKKAIDTHADRKKQDIDKHIDANKKTIDTHADRKKQDIDVHTDRKKQDIDSHKEQKKQHLDKYLYQRKKEVINISNSGRKQSCQIQEEDYSGFQNVLIEFYRKEHSMTSVSPLVEEHEVQLVDFYVKPQLVAVDLQHPFGNPTKTPVKGYEQLFYQGKEKVYKNIYVTSSAGMGKTSFCKHICMTWCQAHNPVKTMNDKFKPEDIQVMLSFKFLFYITLRDVHRSQCHLDDLIGSFVEENLAKGSHHPLHQIFNDKPCLIVVDGLDEWIHPDKCDRRKNEHDIPHRKFRKNWTILTTTRSWKFDVLHLPLNQIDSHIELNELDEKSSSELDQNAINVLNMKFKSGKTVEEFYRTTSQFTLGEIRKIPYLHLHCLCLWFDGRNIETSKCEIYSNILDLTLGRGTQKLQSQSISAPAQQERRATIPKCMKGNEYCVQHQSLLLKMGELAFYALFGSENRQMLVVDYKFAKKYLKLDELNYCLKHGLLSQNKFYGLVSRRISNISFQHKTIQEYLAAFYMQSTILDSSSDRENIHQLCVRTCSTLSRILEMSEVFIFLSGFSSVAYRDISWQLINTVNEDDNTKLFRSRFSVYFFSAEKVMFKYQTLLVNCIEEMELNRQHFHPLPLEDIIINEQSKQAEYISYIQKLIQGNSGGIKSLYIGECENREEITDILKSLDLQYFHSLEKLDLRVVARKRDIERLLLQSVNTIQCFNINNANFKQGKYLNKMNVFSHVSSDTVIRMSSLNSLSLINLKVTHNQLENLTFFLTSRVTMIQINMFNITCRDHDQSCPRVQFYLLGHDNLQLLGLCKVPVSHLQMNIQHLEECWIGGLPPKLITFCLKNLPAAHNLHTLVCTHLTDSDIATLITTLPALLKLEELYIFNTDISDNKLDLNTDMTNFKYIELKKVSMTSSSFRALVDTIRLLSQSVTIDLVDCTVTPDVEYQTVKETIRHSCSFTAIFDGTNEGNETIFRFKTIK